MASNRREDNTNTGEFEDTMAGSDNSWNFVRLQEGQKISSKSLNIDLVSEESHMDDDILSNTSSSDELGEFSFRSANEIQPQHCGFPSISDSLATLTGSKSFEKRDNSWKIKMWHVIVLTSLISVSVSLGIQKFWDFWVVPDLPRDITTLTHDGSPSNDAAVIYSDFNFWATPIQTQDPNLSHPRRSPQWKPTGKYYVDFDNRIAYPMPDEDVVSWGRFKADSMILWYTAKSKANYFLQTTAVGSLQDSYHELLVLVTDKVARIRDRLSIITDEALKSTRLIWELCKDRTETYSRVLQQWLSSRSKWEPLGSRFRRAFRRFHICNYELHKKAQMWHRGTLRAAKGVHRGN